MRNTLSQFNEKKKIGRATFSEKIDWCEGLISIILIRTFLGLMIFFRGGSAP